MKIFEVKYEVKQVVDPQKLIGLKMDVLLYQTVCGLHTVLGGKRNIAVIEFFNPENNRVTAHIKFDLDGLVIKNGEFKAEEGADGNEVATD